MANNKQTEETRTSLDEVNDTLTDLSTKMEKNSKLIVYSCVGVALVVALILIWVYAIRQPGINAANEALGQADIELILGNDSVALQKYQQVARDHGYKAGELATLNAAILLYQDKKYDEALAALKDYSSAEAIIGAGAKSLEGDCYVNLQKYPEAVACFKEAAKISDNNPHYTPLFLLKEATVLHEMKDYKAEAAVYETLKAEYPAYAQETGVNYDKYLERAKALAGQE